ncbi:MAG TPA: hypothetical protein VJT49_14725, partial [Amycolatopsis sp.]|uniref:hypothetical protein n=1 Tax=Amycolatopsis sp. TaxID=37632 RepID=UPI002B4948A4
IESARDDYRSADWRAGAVDSHIQFRNAIIAGKIAITPAVGGDQTTTAEQDILDVIGERDRAEEWADRLAAALAPADVIGEHSNGNNPWANALEWAARKDSLVDDLEREQTARVNAQGDLRVVAEEFPVVPGSPDQVLFAVRALLWLHAEAAARLVEIGQALSGVDFGDHTDCSLVEKIRMLRGNLDNLRAEYFHREREMARAALSGGDQ